MKPADSRGQVSRAELEALLQRCGIADHFINYAGEAQPIALADRVAVLRAMNISLQHDDELLGSAGSDLDLSLVCQQRLQQAVQQLDDGHWREVLPPAVLLQPAAKGFKLLACLNVPQRSLSHLWQWCIRSEHGAEYQGEFQPLQLVELAVREQQSQRQLSLQIAELAPGYHELHISNGSGEQGHCLLIAAPARAWQTPALWQQRLWGVSLQLYSTSSKRNWGIGDFADLQALIELFSTRGADFILLNPLHASALHQPWQCSPYNPADRRWLNPLYIAPELEDEFHNNAQIDLLLAQPAVQQQLRTMRQAAWLDYAASTAFKLQLLALMYQQFKRTASRDDLAALQDFIADGGESLAEYSGWQASNPCAAAGEFAADAGFYSYLQWLAWQQLQQCQILALQCGMAVGLVRDLAVGSDVQGAEVSAQRALFSLRASVGAPPDPLAPQGQNWGLPPLQPQALRAQGFAHFRQLLRRNMCASGALRIDHVMALMRLWWCPWLDADAQGVLSGLGAYVSYPLAELLAILRLESQRQRCMVIGEDLGVVPPTLRDQLAQGGVLSNLLFYFEKDGDSFRSPDHHHAQALAMLANHDVPPLKSWWDGSDLQLRHELGLLAVHDLASAQQARALERRQLRALLESQWLLPAQRFEPDHADAPLDAALTQALLRCLGRSQSRLVSVQVEDLLLLATPINVPGTDRQYRNWQRRLPPDMFERLQSPEITAMLEALDGERA